MNLTTDSDTLALHMESYVKQILQICKQLESFGCRGKNNKCPFFYVNCQKLTETIQEYLKELEKRRQETIPHSSING